MRLPVTACAVLLALCIGAPSASGQLVERLGSGNRTVALDEMQPDTLPTLPKGMTVHDIVAGDSVFHGKGHCFVCHGSEGQGRPAAGDALSVSLAFVQPDWMQIDSLVTAGIPDALTRSPIRMPPRGGKSDLTPQEIRRVAAYVWAISQTHGEPWPGGHTEHTKMVPLGATYGTATRRPVMPPRKKPR
ncbi:MAG TPA: cytochrome c [Gemmatimonadaceae bacterium]|nr:cytochrome c [Gemmatimonadaceae bacterium]